MSPLTELLTLAGERRLEYISSDELRALMREIQEELDERGRRAMRPEDLDAEAGWLSVPT